jgi:hypothetical protein
VRRFLTISLVLGGLLLAGCSTPKPPEVTFFAEGTTITVGPSQYCKDGAEQCDGYPDAKRTLSVPGGKSLQINVPSQVADAPWIVVFKYRAADGTEQHGRTSVFKPGTQYAYTLSAPTAADQLRDVEIQRIAKVTQGTDKGLEFMTDATWVLQISS